MIPWKTEIKSTDNDPIGIVYYSKEEFEKEQISNGWKKIFRPFKGQEVELWCQSHWSGFSVKVWCYAIKDFFESHLDNIPEAEKTVKEWLLTILLQEYNLDEDEWFISGFSPREGWHKAPDGGESFYLDAEDPNYDD